MSAADTSALRIPAERAGRMAQLLRYAIGISAPASVAVAHFAVQLLLLRHLVPEDFGTFALLMVTIQLGYGLSNALISTPYTVALHDASVAESGRQSFFGVNLCFAAAFGIICAAMGYVSAAGPWIAVFSVYALMAMLRWFGRAHCYAVFRQWNAAASDLSYAVLLLIFAGLAWYLDAVNLFSVSLALLGATLGSLVPIRCGFMAMQFGRAAFSSLAPYAETWRSQARWSLLGVITTEATSNAHAYLVSALAGPAAFAPLAAASLFTRPVALAITSLTQLERPALSKAISGRDVGRARGISRTFLIVLMLVWLVVTVLSCALLAVRPDLIAGRHYDVSELQLAFAFLAVIMLLQVMQTPASVFLQAAREFRLLALASTVASVASVVLAFAALMVAAPVYSLFGILAGKAMMTLQLLHRSRNWRPADE